jgi:predicted MPP superfamily phosphohydrolase
LHALSIAFLLRRAFLITLLFLPQRYWLGHGWRLSGRLGSSFWRRIARTFLVLTAIAMAGVLVDRISYKFLPETVSPWIAPIIQLWIFTSTFAFFCIQAVRGIAWMGSRVGRIVTRQAPPQDPGRRALVRNATYLIGGAPYLAAVYGYTRERLQFEIVRLDVRVANLPHALDGLRIVQLSDIHVGDFMPLHEVGRAVAMANSLSPHLAVITGDFLTSAGDPIAECIAELSRLRASLGVWGCNGNHEIYAGAEEDAEELFRLHGMRLLRQSAAQLTWNGASFNLMGIDYQRNIQLTGSQIPSLNGAEKLVRRDMPNILLSHNPNTFYRAAALGVELSLAGHTHGGQVNIEIVNKSWSPARFMTSFVSGLYDLPMRQSVDVPDDAPKRFASLYVNRGLGTLGVPARIGAAPEITLMTLRDGAQAPHISA